MYLPAVVSVSLYFEKKRPLAVGLAMCGTGVGTCTFGPLSTYLLSYMDWKGAHFILGKFSSIMQMCPICYSGPYVALWLKMGRSTTYPLTIFRHRQLMNSRDCPFFYWKPKYFQLNISAYIFLVEHFCFLL